MEKELSELFESVKRAADLAENSPGEEERCLDALKRLKKFPVNYQVLVSTQIGKRLRQLTKHGSTKIKALAVEVVDIWKNIIVKETQNKKNGTVVNGNSIKTESSSATEGKNFQRSNSVKAEPSPACKKLKVEKQPSPPNSLKSPKLESSSSFKSEKVEAAHTAKDASGGYHEQNDKNVKVEKANSGMRKPASDGPPKLTSLVYCKDPLRDKVRDVLGEALSKVSGEVDDDDLKEKVNECDPYRVAVLVETALFERWGKSNGAQKFKYRSLLFNIKDANNPDFRRKVLIGEFEPRTVPDLTPEQMASDARKIQNEKLKQKAMLNSERAAAPKASTNEFTCGRCKKKETTYYQMQTRSADEPMTTFVTCVNCGNHWKFC